LLNFVPVRERFIISVSLRLKVFSGDRKKARESCMVMVSRLGDEPDGYVNPGGFEQRR